jgi:hypothetical protein
MPTRTNASDKPLSLKVKQCNTINCFVKGAEGDWAKNEINERRDRMKLEQNRLTIEFHLAF